MKKLIVALVFLIVMVQNTNAQMPIGKVIEDNTFESKLMKKDVNYAIYLPPDYQTSERKYPVVYLLHGYTDNHIAWIQFGEVQQAADAGIANGTIPPMIIVMPDAGTTWYINDYKNLEPFEDTFIKEFIPYIDATYKTRSSREYRAVAGLSMGGYGSLVFAMRHPNLFTACAPLSAAVYTDAEFAKSDWYDGVFSKLYGEGLKGEKRINEHFKKYSPFYILQTAPIDELKKISFYFDCGDDDFLLQANVDLFGEFQKKGINSQLRVREGKHSWEYWRTGIGDALEFIGKSFHR